MGGWAGRVHSSLFPFPPLKPLPCLGAGEMFTLVETRVVKTAKNFEKAVQVSDPSAGQSILTLAHPLLHSLTDP